MMAARTAPRHAIFAAAGQGGTLPAPSAEKLIAVRLRQAFPD
jgi:hypothetical protein